MTAANTSAPDAHSAAAELAVAITRLRARMRAESIATDGWSASQLSTLSRLIDLGPTTASALAQHEHVRPQSIAETVASLKAGGLVATAQDPLDGRKILLTATRAGRRVVTSVSASRQAWLAHAIEATVSPDERPALAQMIDLLTRLAASDPGMTNP